MPDPILKIEEELVNITPTPVFSWLERLNDRVTGGMEMLGGMRILRIVTTAHMPAFQANTQMYPGVTECKTLLAPLGAPADVANLVQVGAGGHGCWTLPQCAAMRKPARARRP